MQEEKPLIAKSNTPNRNKFYLWVNIVVFLISGSGSLIIGKLLYYCKIYI